MCGIAGVLREDGLPAAGAEQALLDFMLDAMRHRGPDGRGVALHGPLALGHLRLALTGSGSEGAQPIHAAELGWIVSANATFHNATEVALRCGLPHASASDCALLPTLVAHRGFQAFGLLEGPVAAALFEVGSTTLHLVRGHHGHKPLFWTRTAQHVLFASELSALTAVLPRSSVDPQGLAEILRFGWNVPPRTLFSGIHSVAPGTRLSVEPGRAPVEHALPAAQPCETSESGGVLDHLQRAVDRRFATLRRPAAVLLSGGLDSAAVLLCAARHGVSAWSYAQEDPRLDESSVASRIAARCGVPFHAVGPSTTPHEQLLHLTRLSGEALTDPSTLQLAALSHAIGAEATVLLSGDGGDELLLGYRRHGVARAAAGPARLLPDMFWNGLAQCVPGDRRRQGLRALASGPRAFAELAALAPTAVLAAFLRAEWMQQPDPWSDAFRIAGRMPALHAHDQAGRMPALHAHDQAGRMPALHAAAVASRDAAAVAGALDLCYGLPHGLMTKADRASMADGHEIWAPFLDAAVVRYCTQLPGKARRSLTRGKLPLRHELAAHFPSEIVDAPKRGFAAPLNAWCARHDTLEFARATLNAQSDAFEPVLQRPVGVLLEHAGNPAVQPLLWAAVAAACALQTAKEAARPQRSA